MNSNSKLTRRQVLKAGLAAPVAVASIGVAKEAAAETKRDVDVIVIGAGPSGLMATRHLMEAGKDVVVFEANDRVGGQLKRGEIAGVTIDLGGGWLGHGQDRVAEEANRYGMKTYPTPAHGSNTVELDGKAYNEMLIPNELALGYMGAAKLIDDWADRAKAPGFHSSQAYRNWDSMTLETWLLRHIPSDGVRQLIRVACDALMTVPSSQISLLTFMDGLSEYGFLNAVGTVGGGQQDLFIGGFHQITTHIAKELGSRVVLASPVHAIEQHDTGVTVRSEKGDWNAQRVIITVAPSVVNRILFSPSLPYKKSGLLQRMPMGSVIKCYAAYERPFWREKKLSGQAASTTGKLEACIDSTPPGCEKGILIGIFGGEHAQQWSDHTPEERRAQVIKDVSIMLGAEAENMTDYVENVWPRETWSPGGFCCMPTPGTFASFGDTLGEATGRIHWAGTSTGDKFSGYVEGAFRSADRVAKEVMEQLTS